MVEKNVDEKEYNCHLSPLYIKNNLRIINVL